jgi:hypothetical protein
MFPPFFFEFFLSDTHYSREMLNISTTKSYRRRDVTLSSSIHPFWYVFFSFYMYSFWTCRRYVFERGTIHARPHQSSAMCWALLSAAFLYIYLSIIIAGSYGIYCQVIRLIIRAYPNGFGRQLLPSKNSFLSISRKRTKNSNLFKLRKNTKIELQKKMDHFSGIPSHGTLYYISCLFRRVEVIKRH